MRIIKKYVIIKKYEENIESPLISGIWYYVVPKNKFFRFFMFEKVFKDLDRARKVRDKLNRGSMTIDYGEVE